MISEDSIIDEGLDGECICNKAPRVIRGADCIADEWLAVSLTQSERDGELQGRDRLFSICCCLNGELFTFPAAQEGVNSSKSHLSEMYGVITLLVVLSC